MVVQNNIPIQESRKVRVGSIGQNKNYCFPYLLIASSLLNSIETQWHQIETHNSEQIFDSEYDLRIRAIQRMENLREIGNYKLERFIFNSA